MGAEPLKVYWRPGCSSCVRVKEFLSGLGVEYQSIDVCARPESMDELLVLGVRTVPVVTRGADYVFAQELADVSRFVGREVAFRRLPPDELIHKWLAVLEAAQCHVFQIPSERFAQRATLGRNRSVRELAYHVYQVPEAFLAAVEDGIEELASVYNAPPPRDVVTCSDIRNYGADVSSRLARWWNALADKSCTAEVKTYYGPQPLHHLIERCTWHSAQHARQIVALLEGFGVEAKPALTEAHYAGLPMPAGLWE